MRLLESEVYRGKQIRIYIVQPGGFTYAPRPVLSVRVDGQVVEHKPYLTGTAQLPEALVWAHAAIDRLLGTPPGTASRCTV